MRFAFDCVFHHVTDMDAAVSFYSGTLGLRLISRDVVARFDIDGVRFELVPASGAPAAGAGGARLCLSVDDLRGAIAELRAAGARVGDVREVENGLLAPFEDLDGNEIWVWQRRSSGL
jgi:catechol 2,3-dioxygenase-like lactoylglutathione lyase family enzyme